ncbi:hypothetical protein CRM22_009685 [Opisthorchis felineus]|uniref:CortBP2/NAV1-like AAA+ ATPase lid domain-containing protein n=1 Tax=Opisthorchis felineus TaxID=147828 RepID=A0A4S2LCP7_OPIFE|nr:hypothetical protein CRM22_009685 [Opisthorchis felineus]
MPRQLNHPVAPTADSARIHHQAEKYPVLPRNVRGESQPLESKALLHAPQLPIGAPNTCPNSPRYFNRAGHRGGPHVGPEIALAQYNFSAAGGQSGREASPMQQRQQLLGYMVVPSGQPDACIPHGTYGQPDRTPVSWTQFPMYNCSTNVFQAEPTQQPVFTMYNYCPSNRDPNQMHENCGATASQNLLKPGTFPGFLPHSEGEKNCLNLQRTIPNSPPQVTSTTHLPNPQFAYNQPPGFYGMQHPFVPPVAYNPPAPPARGQSLYGQVHHHQPPPCSTVAQTSRASEFTTSGPHMETKISRPSAINPVVPTNNPTERPSYFVEKGVPNNGRGEKKTVAFQSVGLSTKPLPIDSSPGESRNSASSVGFLGNSKLLEQAEQRQRARELYAALKHRHQNGGAAMTSVANLTNTHGPQTLNSSEPVACKMHKHKINSRKPSQRCLSSPTTPIHEQIPHFQHPPRSNEAMPEQKTFVKFPYTNQSDQSAPPNHGMRSSIEKSIQSSGSSSSSSAGATRNVPVEISESRMKSSRPVSASSPYFTRSARIDQSGLRIFNQSQSSTKPNENGSLATLVANRSRDATHYEDTQKAIATEISIQSLNNAPCDLQMTQPSSIALLRTSLPKYCRPPIFTKEKASTQLTPTSYTKLIRDRLEDEADTVHASLINSYDAHLLSWSASNAEEKPNTNRPGLTSASNEPEELDTNTWPSKAVGFARHKNRNTVTCGEEFSKVKATCVQPREPTKSHDPSEPRDGESVRRIRAENLCQLSRFTNVITSQRSLTNRARTRPLSGGLFQLGTMTNSTDPSGEPRVDHLFSFVMSSGKQETQTTDRYFMSSSETGPSNVGGALRVGHDSELALMTSRSDASRESSTSRGLLPSAKQVNPTKLLSTVERCNTLPWSQRNLFKNEHTSNASEKIGGVMAHLENEVGRVQNLASTVLSCTQRRIPTEGGLCETTDRQQDPSNGGTISAPPGTPIKLPYAPPSYRLHQTLESHGVRGITVEGSTLSLSSNTSDISVVEQNPDDEVKLLRKKLQSAQTEVVLLTSQLVMNAQVVSAFEQSLNSISQRLKNLTTTTARKDSELHELRATIDALRCQSGFGLHSLGNQQLLVTGNQVVLSEATTPFQQVPQPGSVHVPAIDETVNTQPDGKPNDANQRKSSWFRGSIGKAFRKKSSLPPTKPATTAVQDIVHNTCAMQMSSASTINHANVTQVHGIHPTPNAPNTHHSLEPIAATNLVSQVPSNQSGRIQLNGLSPSNSSTSNSSWSASGLVPQPECGKGNCSATTPSDPKPNLHNGITVPVQTPNCSRHTIVPNYLFDAHHTGDTESPYSLAENQSEKPQYEGKNGSNMQQAGHSVYDQTNKPQAVLSPISWLGSIMDDAFSDISSTDSPTVRLQAELNRLRQQLSERDLKLTDVQLEALASTHQVNQLRDQLSRVYAEMQHLRSDNARLQQMMTTKTVVSTSTVTSTILETPKVDGCLTVSTKTENETNWPFSSDFDFLAGLVQERNEEAAAVASTYRNNRYARVYLLIVRSTNDCSEINLGMVDLNFSSSWSALGLQLLRLYRNYINRIDPQNRLSILEECISVYKLHCGTISREHKVTVSEEIPKEEQLSPDDLPSFLQNLPPGGAEIELRMQSKPNGFVASMSIDSLIPYHTLEAYLGWLEDHYCLVICLENPTQMDLTRLLLDCLKCSRRISQEHHIKPESEDDLTEQIKHYLTSSEEGEERTCKTENLGTAIVIERLEMSADHFQNFLCCVGWKSPNSTENAINNRTYIIAFSTPKPPPSNSIAVELSSAIPNAKPYLSSLGFCWVCTEQQSYEDMKYTLCQSLRKRIIHVVVDHCVLEQAGLGRERKKLMQRLVAWLEEVWDRVNKLLMKSYSSDSNSGFLSPKVFRDLPLANSEDWFVEFWNQRLIRKMQQLRSPLQHNSPDEDPIPWVTATWPWTSTPHPEEIKSRLLLPLPFPCQSD